MIEAMGLQRKDVYICNVVKCRPPENRTPEPDEVQTCSPYLLRQIDTINPKVIVCLGAVAAKTLLQTTRGISQYRGEWQEWRGRKLLATYHPAYLLRNPTGQSRRLERPAKSNGRTRPATAEEKVLVVSRHGHCSRVADCAFLGKRGFSGAICHAKNRNVAHYAVHAARGFVLLTVALHWLGGWGRLADGSGWRPWAWGVLVGVLNTCGTLALYRSFEIGKMSIVAPISSSYPALTMMLAATTGERLDARAADGICADPNGSGRCCKRGRCARGHQYD